MPPIPQSHSHGVRAADSTTVVSTEERLFDSTVDVMFTGVL